MTVASRRGDWIGTFTGRQIWPLDVRPEDIDIEDIAAGLRALRFGGHTRTPYSVAEHSVRVSWACDPLDALWGLLHDASEAYLGDVVTPLKRSDAFADYRTYERLAMDSICRRFGLSYEEPASVKHADLVMLATEKRDLLNQGHPWSRPLPPPLDVVITPWDPETARTMFLERFRELARKGVAA